MLNIGKQNMNHEIKIGDFVEVILSDEFSNVSGQIGRVTNIDEDIMEVIFEGEYVPRVAYSKDVVIVDDLPVFDLSMARGHWEGNIFVE